MTFTLAAIVLTWKSGLFAIAAVIFAIVFLMGGLNTPRAWNLEALGLCLMAIAWALWTAGAA